jgi:hypothetical protein
VVTVIDDVWVRSPGRHDRDRHDDTPSADVLLDNVWLNERPSPEAHKDSLLLNSVHCADVFVDRVTDVGARSVIGWDCEKSLDDREFTSGTIKFVTKSTCSTLETATVPMRPNDGAAV